MFDDILKMVKEHFSDHPAVANLTAEQQDALHTEIANHVANTMNTDTGTTTTTTPAADVTTTTTVPSNTGGGGGLLGKLEDMVASGGTVTNAIEGGLVSSLASKFGLPPSITGAIAGALPGLLQKFAAKQKGN